MLVVACPDKFRGTASSVDAADSIASAVESAGHEVLRVPMADGGEGTLDVLGGANRSSVVRGPLGGPVEVTWRFSRGVAVIEMAKASGLELVGGATGNEPLEASTFGTGQLLAEAVSVGARRVIVAVGGSATTDGGLGALKAMGPLGRYKGVEIEVACDVRTRFVDAAAEFGSQKGASAAQVELLKRRLERLVDVYLSEHGVDVSGVVGSGAAGGLAGGLLAAGATLTPGFELVAEAAGLHEALDQADLVITGEGHLDESSFSGKVVGGVVSLASELDLDVAAVVGVCDPAMRGRLRLVDLVERFGLWAATSATPDCIERAAAELLEGS